MSAATTAFVERVRAERAERGHPEQITGESVYRLLDGILATRRSEEGKR